MKGCLRDSDHFILPEKGLDNPQEGEDGAAGAHSQGKDGEKTSGEGECFVLEPRKNGLTPGSAVEIYRFYILLCLFLCISAFLRVTRSTF